MLRNLRKSAASVKSSLRYRAVRRLSAGGMGAVYEARQLGVNGFEKTVAIKRVIKKLSGSDRFVRLFIGEAKLVADLVHENIVQVYHLGFRKGFFMVMEYVDGVDLLTLLRKVDVVRELPVDLGVFIISRVCRALEYAHEKRGRDGDPLGIVHRDVSPSNVMLNSEGVVKLTDFGIAKARLEMIPIEECAGKVEYMSPEQAEGEGTDARSDIFSCGVLMYELLTGVQVFNDKDTTVVRHNIQRKPVPDPRRARSDLPEPLVRIMARALKRDPEKRFQRSAEMGAELERFIYGKGYGPTNQTLRDYLRDRELIS